MEFVHANSHRKPAESMAITAVGYDVELNVTAHVGDTGLDEL